MQGIQFIGTQRSGSNLLRVMLHQMNEITAPHPPHILLNFGKFISSYGKLSKAKNFERLVTDICLWVNHNPVPWDFVHLEPHAIIDQCRSNTLPEVFKVIYEAGAKAEGSDFWCCKSMANVYIAQELEQENICPIYLYLVRDGRDVALSFQKAIVGEKHLYHLAKKWKKDQEAALALKKTIPENRFIEVKYEDLLTDPEKTIRNICEKLNIPFQSDFNNYHLSEESKNTSESGVMWQNVKRPVLKNNFGKYRELMSQKDLQIFESIAGDTLETLGYQVHTQEADLILKFSEKDRIEFHMENNKLKDFAQLSARKEDLSKRKWQKEFAEQMMQADPV